MEYAFNNIQETENVITDNLSDATQPQETKL
jgi:aerobic C4-dicarboxylate transport protein